MTGAALQFDDVHLTYRGRRDAVLNGVDLEVPESQFCVLLGRSGTGKSTLLRCVNGLVTPSSGAVRVAGEPVTQGGAKLRRLRRRVGVVFQSYNLVNRLTAMQNVMTGMLGDMPAARSMSGFFSAEHRERAVALLDSVGLAEHADQRADELSGGQKQRVGIARALAQNPTIILADEPIASLDPVTSGEILGLLRTINERDGITVLVSLHQIEFARAYGERIVALLGGKVAVDTAPSGLGDDQIAAIYGESARKAA